MNIETIKLVCFSPTGTTKTVLKSIAEGFGEVETEILDITTPEKRDTILKTKENELLIVGAPVYMGRLPEIINGFLSGIEADKTSAVPVVVYGNREYDDALLELNDLLEKRGAKVIAGAAFIGEHSFSSSEFPTAEGRPDKDDHDKAKEFGRKIKEKLLSSNPSINSKIPGENPYGGATTLWDVDFIEVNDKCIQCALCSDICPASAIDEKNSSIIDTVKCITCCACIKICPEAARTIKEGPVKEAQKRLNNLYSERKEPQVFL